MTNKQKRSLGMQLFVYNDMRQKEIAQYLSVTEATVSRWAQADKWEDTKAANTVTRDNIIRNLYIQAQQIQDKANEENRNLDSKEMDIIMKIAAAIEKLDKKLTIQTVIMVFKDFNKYLLDIDPEICKQLVDYQRKFIYSLHSNE